MRTFAGDQARERLGVRAAGRLAPASRSGRRRRVVLALVVAAAAACVVAEAGTARPLRTTDAAGFARADGTPVARVAPLNEALRRYLEERAVAGAQAAPGSPAGGLVPAPIDFSRLSGAASAAAGPALPPAYDLRPLGRLGPVDDQGTYGACWAFAALDSLESVLMPTDPQDFSEDNLVLASGFDGDPYQTGGNALEAVAYLARWGGPLTAAEDAYGDATTPRGGLPVKHVQEVLFIPPRSGPLDNAGIKQAVIGYGAVYTVMYFGGPDPAYFNDATDAYYCWGDEPFDHAVTVVGWDDGYARGKFLDGHEPPGDGAFLVRNSWGASFGRDGYFWVSYFDSCIGSRLGPPGTTKENGDVNAVVAGAEPAGNFEDIYQHDPLGWTDSLGFGSDTAWCAASYTAGSDDPLVAVSFYTAALDSSYEVYAGLGDTTQLNFRQAGSEPLPGYHTIRLDAPVPLEEGQTFTVAVKLVTPGHAFPIPLETNIDGYSSAASAAPGESYVSPDGVAWTDVTTMPEQRSTSVCLKAFTRPAGPEDLTAPFTTVSGASAAWRTVPLTLQFDATDGSPGSGVAFTQSKVGDADWRTGEQAVVPAPSTHVNDGVHVVLYRSVDGAGNVETVNMCVAKIDTRRPTVEATRPCVVRRGHFATLEFRPRDPRPSRGACRVVIDVRTRSQRLLVSFRPRRWYACGDLGGYRLRCPTSLARGDYRFWVTARDGAGNVSKAAANRLTVR